MASHPFSRGEVPVKTILETDRLLLREFMPDDAEDFFRMVSDPDVTRYTGDGAKTLEEARKGLEERIFHDYRKYGYGRWAVVFKPAGQVIGFAGLKYLDDVSEVDLGYRFFKEYWGRGLATEASRALLAYGFDVLRLERVVGIVDVENKASIRVLEKVGFKFEKFTTFRGHEVAWYIIEKSSSGSTTGRGS
jgi:RimJ/RimL family protein N-acetyltransferase